MEENQYKKLPQSTPSLPVEKHGWLSFVLIALLSFIFGAMAFGVLIFYGGTDAFMTDGQCIETMQNNTILAYQQGIIDVANWTTHTGNFTYILNNSIGNQNVQDYCIDMIQNLNNQEVQK